MRDLSEVTQPVGSGPGAQLFHEGPVFFCHELKPGTPLIQGGPSPTKTPAPPAEFLGLLPL